MPAALLLYFRRAIVVLLHVLLFMAALLGAFALRFDFSIPAFYVEELPRLLAIVVVARLSVFASLRMFNGLWRYTGAPDAYAVVKATAISSTVFAAAIALADVRTFPRSVFTIDALLTMGLVGGLRFGVRGARQFFSSLRTGAADRRRVLVVGAGDAGEMLVREMLRVQGARFMPVALLDDDRAKHGLRIHGIPVVDNLNAIERAIHAYQASEVVVAIPRLPPRRLRELHERARRLGVGMRTVPGVEQLLDGQVTVSQLRPVAIEDLLGRSVVELDTASIGALAKDAVVMVTGAGGSIGSELCRQVLKFAPRQLVLVERSEPALFAIDRELAAAGAPCVPCVADIADARRMRSLFTHYRPRVVVHAAAHKHVPMMELNPGEAIKNNVGGTRVIADFANEFRAQIFVMVSTDKAVNPTSVMGSTKRLAELYIQGLASTSQTRFVAVRFGNVLGSAGSVIPIFREQIAAGGPVTVTHPEMRRYFMTIPEASQLVLQAASLGQGGEIFVLDMGEPVRIVDLARDLITLSGYVPGKDIDVVFTGIRPGEKLFEELSTADEVSTKTRHPRIFIGCLHGPPWAHVAATVDALLRATDSASDDAVRRYLAQSLAALETPLEAPLREAARASVPEAETMRDFGAAVRDVVA